MGCRSVVSRPAGPASPDATAVAPAAGRPNRPLLLVATSRSQPGSPRGTLCLKSPLEASHDLSGAQRPVQLQTITLAILAGKRELRGGSSSLSDELPVTRQTVGKWRSRLLKGRLQGLDDDGQGAPRTITDERVEKGDRQDPGGTALRRHPWSTRSMAKSTGMSQTVAEFSRAAPKCSSQSARKGSPTGPISVSGFETPVRTIS